MHVLVELVRVSDTGHVQGLSNTNERPQCRTVSLSDDVIWKTVTTGVPASGKLTTDLAAERERFGDEDASTLLELEEPLITFTSPDITLVGVLELEFVCFRFGNFDRLKVMCKLNLLLEGLLVWIISTEKFRF
jgi:hypothetical protein